MGFPGNTAAPEVQTAIDDAMRQIIASGKAAGILTFDLALAKHYREMGVTFLGVGGDIPLLLNAANALAAAARDIGSNPPDCAPETPPALRRSGLGR